MTPGATESASKAHEATARLRDARSEVKALRALLAALATRTYADSEATLTRNAKHEWQFSVTVKGAEIEAVVAQATLAADALAVHYPAPAPAPAREGGTS